MTFPKFKDLFSDVLAVLSVKVLQALICRAIGVKIMLRIAN